MTERDIGRSSWARVDLGSVLAENSALPDVRSSLDEPEDVSPPEPHKKSDHELMADELRAAGWKVTAAPKQPSAEDRRRWREASYGLRPGDYEDLNTYGGGKCWICRRPETAGGRSLAIDHCHTTGAVRGLLCGRCNQALGLMDDSIWILMHAASYLGRVHKAFSDCCSECPDSSAVRPCGIAELDRDGGWTVFAYECSAGHKWTCGWQTFGLPESLRP